MFLNTLFGLNEAKISWFCLKDILGPAPNHLPAVKPLFLQVTYMGGEPYPGKTSP